MQVVVELVERALQIWVIADARSDFHKAPISRSYVVTMGWNVVEVRVCADCCSGDQESCHTSHDANGDSYFHLCGLQELTDGGGMGC